MVFEKSCGAIVYTIEDSLDILEHEKSKEILKQADNYINIPFSCRGEVRLITVLCTT